MMDLAFNQKRADHRKMWLGRFNGVQEVSDLKIQSLSNFVVNELVLFELENVARSLNKIDSLKQSQRKLVWYGHKLWGFKSSSDKFINVSVFANETKAKSSYHYGPKSLEDCIVKMGCRHVGTNNLSIFYPKGNFGTRDADKNGDAGRPRYISTYFSEWIPFIFKDEDTPLLTTLTIDGKEVEPAFFLPILPNVLFNGTLGIGTGHSTFIPNCNPKDVAAWYKAKLTGAILPEVLPWYNKFKGIIKVVNTAEPKIKLKIDANGNATIKIQSPKMTVLNQPEIKEEIKDEMKEEHKDPRKSRQFGRTSRA